MWGIRFVIPRKLKDQVLKELHREHSGIVLMDSIARGYIRWPQIHKQLEEIVMK